jgi:hypothetical protein
MCSREGSTLDGGAVRSIVTPGSNASEVRMIVDGENDAIARAVRAMRRGRATRQWRRGERRPRLEHGCVGRVDQNRHRRDQAFSHRTAQQRHHAPRADDPRMRTGTWTERGGQGSTSFSRFSGSRVLPVLPVRPAILAYAALTSRWVRHARWRGAIHHSPVSVCPTEHARWPSDNDSSCIDWHRQYDVAPKTTLGRRT